MTSTLKPIADEELREVDIHKITVNPDQPRQQFADEDLHELAASIALVGILHPPLVMLHNDGYELVSGERRLRAAKLAGLTKIPVVVRQGNRAFSAEAALIENIQRVDLNPIEIAKALQSLSKQFNLNQEALSLRIGKKRSTVANYLRLLTLPPKIQGSVSQGHLSMGHAKAILSVEDKEQQLALHDKVIAEKLSVRQVEETAQKWTKSAKKQPLNASKDIFIAEIEEKLQKILGTKVTLTHAKNKGCLAIDYYSLDDLDRLLHFFGI